MWGALNCIFPIVLPVYITVWVCIKHALYHENDKPTWHVNTSKSIYHCDIGTIVTSTCVSVKNDPWTLEHGLSETWRPCARLPAKLGLFSSFVFSSISHKTNAKFCLFLDMCDCEDALDSQSLFPFDEVFFKLLTFEMQRLAQEKGKSIDMHNLEFNM